MSLLLRGRLLRGSSFLLHAGGMSGPISPGGDFNRRFSLKKPTQHDMVPVSNDQPAWIGKLPKSLRRWVDFRTEGVENHDHLRGRIRAEMNWPMKMWTDVLGERSYAMTPSELEEYYATPKDGVDFMYDAPAGSEQNPLVIEQGISNMYSRAVVYCKGLCAPHVHEQFYWWQMTPGPLYHCQKCTAWMILDGKEDLMVAPHQAPLPHEEFPPFEYLEGEFEFWMKRGFPLMFFAVSSI